HHAPVEIIASDISNSALKTAQLGRFRERSMRFVDPSLRSRYFMREQSDYVVGDNLRQLVTFHRHNMVNDLAPPPGAECCMAIICRNVFIYFEPTTVQHVLSSLQNSLADGGTLIVGATDALVRDALRNDATFVPKVAFSPSVKAKGSQTTRARAV